MLSAKLFPIGLILLNLGAAAGYALAGNYKFATYYVLSAGCLVCLNF